MSKWKTLAEQIAEKCVHYNGLSGPGLAATPETRACKAGVPYKDVRDSSRSGFGQYPCFKEGDCVPCDKRHFPTKEEIDAEVAESDRRWEQIKTAMLAVHADAKERGYKKGNGGGGEIKCPCCDAGRLRYSFAGYNCHIHGRCSTAGCVSWMQ